ncbi:MAG: hypothetical protein WCO67_06795 [Betaproteobacteria bacterium]
MNATALGAVGLRSGCFMIDGMTCRDDLPRPELSLAAVGDAIGTDGGWGDEIAGSPLPGELSEGRTVQPWASP